MTTTEMTTTEQAPASLTVFGTEDPIAILARVELIAAPLAKFINEHGMSKVLASDRRKAEAAEKGEELKRYVMIEGWSFMGAMLGVAPCTVATRELLYPNGGLRGFEADAELVMRDGRVAARGTAECSYDEPTWRTRDPFALKSMAQTRAVGKAFRLGLGFVMSAAGFESTPLEEMPPEEDAKSAAGRAAEVAQQASETLDDVIKWAWNTHGLSLDQILEVLKVERSALAPLNGPVRGNPNRQAGIARMRAAIEAAMAPKGEPTPPETAATPQESGPTRPISPDELERAGEAAREGLEERFGPTQDPAPLEGVVLTEQEQADDAEAKADAARADAMRDEAEALAAVEAAQAAERSAYQTPTREAIARAGGAADVMPEQTPEAPQASPEPAQPPETPEAVPAATGKRGGKVTSLGGKPE